MKFQPHKLITVGDNQLIVSDGEIKEEDNILCFVNGEIADRTHQNKVGTIGKCVFENGNDGSVWKKIIAQLPSSKPLKDIPLCEEIGVEELAEIIYPLSNRMILDQENNFIESQKQDSFIVGYDLNKSDEVFTESDMVGFAEYAVKNCNAADEEKFLFKQDNFEPPVVLIGKDLVEKFLQYNQTIQLLCNDDGEPIMIDNTFKYKQ